MMPRLSMSKVSSWDHDQDPIPLRHSLKTMRLKHRYLSWRKIKPWNHKSGNVQDGRVSIGSCLPETSSVATTTRKDPEKPTHLYRPWDTATGCSEDGQDLRAGLGVPRVGRWNQPTKRPMGRCCLKWWYPQIILIGFSIISHPFLGHLYFRKPPYLCLNWIYTCRLHTF